MALFKENPVNSIKDYEEVLDYLFLLDENLKNTFGALDPEDNFDYESLQKYHEKNEKVDVVGTSKGHGFSGVIKRWNQRRLKETHGVGPVHREVGSMGANSTPSRVFKQKHMPGQYGNERVTVQNLEIVKVDAARNALLIKGAIPGAKGSVVTVCDSVKAK